MSKGFLKTDIGVLEITAENGKIIGVELVPDENEYIEDCPNEAERKTLETAKVQLKEYFSGSRQKFSLDIELRGTDFQKSVWQVLGAIPYGKTMSYAQVAEASGHPGAQRAAGSAVGKNPLLIVVPCHRVIKSDGSLGGFSSGIDNKVILQKLEGIL